MCCMSFICFRAILDDVECVNWNCVEFCRVSGNFQKLPGGVEGPLGGSCLQSLFSGFLLCIAWWLGTARQATQTGLSSFLGFLDF